MPTWTTTQEDRRLLRTWGEYLASFAWSHWATLTPPYGSRPGALHRHFVNVFVRRLAGHAQRPIHWFYGMEKSPGGVFHLHALLYCPELAVDAIRAAWGRGNCQADHYRTGGGAAWYLAKTFHRASEEWEEFAMSRQMPPRRVAPVTVEPRRLH